MLRDIIVFLAGGEAFHTLSHLALPYFVKFPLTTSYVVFTASMNVWAIVINGVITIALLCLAAKMKRKA
jgi:hypothetical protein